MPFGVTTTPPVGPDAVTAHFQQCLDAMGFTRAIVENEAFLCNNWNLWDLSVSWEEIRGIAPDARNRDSKAASRNSEVRGTTVECIVCFETGAAVALVPCGHAVCRACAGRI